MGVRDHQVPESFVKTLRRHLPGFMTLTPVQQVRMAHYIWITGGKARSHDTLKGCTSFSYKELEDAFERGQFNILNDRLGVFDVTEKWSKVRHTTKGYRLSAAVQDIKDQYLSGHVPVPAPSGNPAVSGAGASKPITLLSMNARPIVTLPNVLAAKDTNENTATAWRDVKLTRLVPVNLAAMQDMHRQLAQMITSPEKDLFADASSDDIAFRLESLGQLIVLANTESAGPGKIAHRYMEQSTGRLGGQGISLQNAPRIVRKAALHGMFDYDIENCHYAIFAHLAKQYGSPCSAIDRYLANKAETRSGIALRVGIAIDQVKTALLALMFGSPLSPREENAIPQAIGRDKAIQLYKDAEFAAIADDIKAGRKLILANWLDRTPRTLQNAMGKTISLKETPAKKLAHILQGIEANALRAVLRAFGDDVLLPVHDGFVSRVELDEDRIEQVIFDETGINLKVSGERMSIPANLEFTKVLKAA